MAEDLATFCKRKGFIYPSSEIYGGISGLYDYGHLGTLLKQRFENLWRQYFLSLGDNYYEIEASEIMHEGVFKASGHLENFTDPVAICDAGHFDRADHILEKKLGGRYEDKSNEEMQELLNNNNIVCDDCQKPYTQVKVINMMFPLQMGVGNKNTAYLRPETAQSPFVNFRLQYELLRKKLPMGLAVVGKAYRNEISPRNLTLRQRAFTQAELQIFFNPKNFPVELSEDYELRTMLVEDREQKMVVARSAKQLTEKYPAWYVQHMVLVQKFYLDILKIPKEKFRFYQLSDKEKAFYNKIHFDIEIELEHGFTEVTGLHYRTDHDLLGHQKQSGQKMEVIDEATGDRFIPHVLELSFGVDRNVYSLLDLNHEDAAERGNTVLHLPKNVTPFLCAVFPLVKNKEEVVNKAKEVQELVEMFPHYYDQASSVGRRYARADEVGVKYCITIDFESLEDNAVTVRDRDTTKQERIAINKLQEYLHNG